MPRSLALGNGTDYSLQALNGNCNLLCWASQKTEELCCPKGLGLFQVIQDRLVKVGKSLFGMTWFRNKAASILVEVDITSCCGVYMDGLALNVFSRALFGLDNVMFGDCSCVPDHTPNN